MTTEEIQNAYAEMNWIDRAIRKVYGEPTEQKVKQSSQELFAELDKEVMRACKTKIWINPNKYKPTQRELEFIVGIIGELK